MKKVLLIIFLYFSASFAYAQVVAPNFSLSNTNDEPYTLYDEIEAGKTVVLSFFSVSCGPCAEDVPHLQELLEANDESEFTLMAIETFFANNQEIDSFITLYGGLYSGFSTAENNEILSDSIFNIEYTPQNVVICPDYSYKKVDIEYVQELVDKCPSAASSSNQLLSSDFGVINISSDESIYVQFYADKETDLKFEIIDLLGNTRSHKEVVSRSGENTITLDNKNMKTGYYLLKMLNENRVVDVKKFIIF